MLLNNVLEVFEEFMKDFKLELTGSFIAKKNKLNQKTVSNILNKLENELILKSRIQGKNKLFSLNLENKEIIKNFLVAMEHIRTIRFYKKNPLIKEIVNKIGAHIQGGAVIFGSYAKGLQKKDSDLDILILGKCDEKEINKIGKLYQVEINLKIYPTIKKEDHLIKEVNKNHVLIKNVDVFMEGQLNG